MSFLWLMSFHTSKQSNAFIIWVLLALFLLMVTTYTISTIRFLRAARNVQVGHKPPTAPYWLPGLYHLPGLLSGPSPYNQGLLNRYGTLAPFFIWAGPVPILIVTEPAHIKSIFMSSKQITPKQFHLTVFEKVLGLPKKAVKVYAGDETLNSDTQAINFAHLTLNRKYMSGAPLAELTELYTRALRKNVSEMRIDPQRWTNVEDLWALFRTVIPKAIIDVILGPTMLEMHPDIVEQFWAFDDNLQEYSRRMLRHALTSSPYTARDRILKSIKQWISITQPAYPDTEAIINGSFWNSKTGSKLFRHRDSIFASVPDMGLDGRASETLGLLQGATANTVPSTFWYIFEALRDARLRHRLRCEIDANPNDILGLCNSPLLQSMQSEVTRCRMATAVIRKVDEDDVLLANHFAVPKGTTVLAFPSDAALNTKAWRSVRPQTLARPLEEFWAERFLVPETRSLANEKDDPSRRKDKAMRFSAEGLNTLHFTFGGGQNMCPGKAWAKNIQIATLAVLFTDFEVELVNEGPSISVVPPMRTTAVGTIEPRTKVGVRIRSRSKMSIS